MVRTLEIQEARAQQAICSENLMAQQFGVRPPAGFNGMFSGGMATATAAARTVGPNALATAQGVAQAGGLQIDPSLRSFAAATATAATGQAPTPPAEPTTWLGRLWARITGGSSDSVAARPATPAVPSTPVDNSQPNMHAAADRVGQAAIAGAPATGALTGVNMDGDNYRDTYVTSRGQIVGINMDNRGMYDRVTFRDLNGDGHAERLVNLGSDLQTDAIYNGATGQRMNFSNTTAQIELNGHSSVLRVDDIPANTPIGQTSVDLDHDGHNDTNLGYGALTSQAVARDYNGDGAADVAYHADVNGDHVDDHIFDYGADTHIDRVVDGVTGQEITGFHIREEQITLTASDAGSPAVPEPAAATPPIAEAPAPAPTP